MRDYEYNRRQNVSEETFDELRRTAEHYFARSVLAESEEQKYRLIFDNAPLGIIFFDQMGVITSTNKAFTDEFHSIKKLKVGLSLLNINNDPFERKVHEVLSGKNCCFYGDIHCSVSNSSIPVKVNFISGRNIIGNQWGGFAIWENLTAVLEINRLEYLLARARDSIRIKQHFLANFSHELKTPLIGIAGGTELLEKSNLSPSDKELVKIVKESASTLSTLIERVLDFSQLESKTVELKIEPVVLEGLIHKVVKRFGDDLAVKRISVTVEIHKLLRKRLFLDPVYISKIFETFLSNAIKFSDTGCIEVVVKPIDFSDANFFWINISVKDEGCGISLEKQDKVFTPFFDFEDSDKRMYDGIGLSLAHCKLLTDNAGDKIGFSSSPSKGSCFWFETKIWEVDPGSDVHGFSQSCQILRDYNVENKRVGGFFDVDEFSGDGAIDLVSLSEERVNTTCLPEDKELKILIAEDKGVTRQILKIILESEGHAVTFAFNGKQAIDLFEPGLFDVILMDIQMPVMDGLTATNILRESYSDLPPIIGLSANTFPEDEEKYIAQGLDAYLHKPLDYMLFRKMYRRVLSEKKGIVA